MRFLSVTIAIVLIAVVAPSGQSQETLVAPTQWSGSAIALDSDVLVIGEQIIRLAGIDGMERHQYCYVDGKAWACGAPATRTFQTLVDTAKVTCIDDGTELDGRVVAVCTADGLDLAEVMVFDGWALALPGSHYGEAEAQARAARRGIWQGNFVEPWTYRGDIATIERHYRIEAVEMLERAAEAAMTDRDGWIFVLEGFNMAEVPADTKLWARRVKVPDVAKGFTDAAIAQRDAFSWLAVAMTLGTWQKSAIAEVKANAVDLLWEELLDQPAMQVTTTDALRFYMAMTTHAAKWIAEGRQPVLFVRSPLVPSWLKQWFGDEPPTGALVVQRTGIGTPTYLGSIDGIDVYFGNVPDDVSILLPSDILQQVSYGRSGDRPLFDVSREVGDDNLSVEYSVDYLWRNDKVVWLRYPKGETEVLDEK